MDYPFLQEARRRGAKVVCVDPNRTVTAKRADSWISLRPGTDGALALSLLGEIFALGLQSSSFLSRHSNASFLVREETGGFLREQDVTGEESVSYMVWDARSRTAVPHGQAREPSLTGRYPVPLAGGETVLCAPALQLLRDLTEEFPPERTAEITEVPAQSIRDLAREFATCKPSSIRIGFGVDRWYYSDYTARAVAALAVATGNIGIPGGGISLHSGTYPVPLNLRTFRSPQGKSAETLDVISLMSAIETGNPYPVKALWLSAANLFNQTAANRGRVISDILPQLEFLVVSDHFLTASAEVADLVLPACTIFEKTDLIPGIFFQLQQKVVEPEGESKSDLEIFAGLADRLGFGEYFRDTPEDYLEEVLAVDHPLLEGVTLERLRREGAVFLNRPPEPYVAFQDLNFDTPSGRIELYKEELVKHGAQLPVYREPIEASQQNPLFQRYPLTLLFSHSRHRIHSTFANMPMIKKLDPEPVVDIHPADAAARGIDDEQLVRVYNERGSVTLKCRLSPDLRPGVVVISEGYWVRDFRDGEPYGLTHDLVSPTSENYAFYDTLVEVEKI
ncbi:MAG: molybdopterin-dependent oxidoreductase [Candidatus Tectomicrobia bacterium]|uniref:Molybdopterin-dependent oxidoreductase n=1 Tax=Tectimicrobiota bacterium TaxID=2528274 RepID=A0A932GMA0_UNCTE|nr:molybdopterin-dependent oxidoreductase [Candidatus Tectomicrobia bacterium]